MNKLSINLTPDPAPTLAAFDVDAYLASPPTPGEQPPFDTSGWSVVPVTVQDEKGFTVEDYEEAAKGFVQSDEPDALELAAQATGKAWAMRKWLMMARPGGKN